MDSHPIKALIIRLLPSTGMAISNQGIRVIAVGFEFQTQGLEPQDPSDSQTLKFIPNKYPKIQNIFGYVRSTINFWRILRAESPDIVQINALQDLLPATIAIHCLSPFKKRPALVAMAHNPNTWKKPRSAWVAAKLICVCADGFVCLSTKQKELLIHLGVPASKLILIPNPYDPEQTKLTQSEDNRIIDRSEISHHIVYIANVCERKAQDVLIRAASMVIKKYPLVKFDFIGKPIPGEELFLQKITSLIKELNIEKQVTLAGEMPYRKAMVALANSDIFVFPSFFEVMPRAVIEAMLAGKPVIASEVDGILDLIEQRKTGILVPPGDPEAIADAIDELIDNPSLAKRLGASGQDFVLEFCSPERVGKLYKDFYESVLNRTL
jgi:glycosyltransferase involved in cell wall biosynthesis